MALDLIEPAPTSVTELRSRLRADLTSAIKARQRDAVSALRTVIAAIDNAEAVEAPASQTEPTDEHIAGARAGVGSTEVPRRVLCLADALGLVQAEISERIAEADRMELLGQQPTADRLRREAAILQIYPGV